MPLHVSYEIINNSLSNSVQAFKPKRAEMLTQIALTGVGTGEGRAQRTHKTRGSTVA